MIGDAVNLACRRWQNAKAGEIIVTQATYDEIKDTVELEPMGPVLLKGKHEPIQIYRVMRRQVVSRYIAEQSPCVTVWDMA